MKQLGLQRRGESEESIARRRGSRQGRESTYLSNRGQASPKSAKTGVSVAPTKRTYVFQKGSATYVFRLQNMNAEANANVKSLLMGSQKFTTL